MVMRKTFFCAAFAGALGLGAGAAPVSLESAQDYVRTIAGTNASNVVLYSPTEAVKIIDTVFKPNREDVSDWPDWKFEQMKHLVADGFAALIGYDDIEHEDGNWEKTFATREYRLVHRFHGRDERSGRRNDEEYVYYLPESGFYVDWITFRKDTGKKVYGIGTTPDEPKPVALLFGSDVNVGLDNRAGTNVDVSVVADVETVTLSSVSGLEKVIAAGGAEEDAEERGIRPIGHYRVSLLVRTALVGDAPANRLVFTAKTGAANATVGGHWLFYRGMTLKVGLRKAKKGFSVCRIEPVLPYPPFTTDGIVVCDAEVSRESRFSLVDRDFAAVDRGSLTVLYGDHTRVDYFSDRSLIEGCCGMLPDFGLNAWQRVWTHGKEARLDYWRNAWFADTQSRRLAQVDPESEVPLFAPALKSLGQGEDRLRFNWWNLVLSYVSIRPPATMKDAVEFLTVASRPCACSDDEAYRIVVDSKVAQRPVRPFAVSRIGAWEALQRVASENGCKIEISGTNVTLTAELSDAEVVTPRVTELEATLAKEGFGSVVGARYARVSFSPYGLWKGKDWRGRNSCFNIGKTAVSEAALERAIDEEGELSGNGWMRTASDGSEEFLAFDSVWWNAAKGWRPNGEKDDVIGLCGMSVRLRRDLFRSIDTLNLLADGAFGWNEILNEGQVKVDATALAFALHACQAGFKSEGQQLIDAMWRRPAAAKKALAKLRERIGRPEAKCRTSREWYLLMQDRAEKQAKEKDEGEDKEGKDEGDAD